MTKAAFWFRLCVPALFWLTPAANAAPASADKVPSTRDLEEIRREVETLRGKKFLHDVPVYDISEKELRAISDRDIEKDYPGAKLADYEELLAWLGMVPPHTDLKAVYANYLVDQVAGLYDSEAKEMCIPSSGAGKEAAGEKLAEKKLADLSDVFDDIVFAHEYTHALEDQYWPLDDPRDDDSQASTDRGTAHSFVAEGSATRLMVEALPAQAERASPGSYFTMWNLIHSGLGEFVLNYALGEVWKSSDAKVAGVPETLARTEAMPYSYGYTFCTKVMREWGLDGLDYLYDHPAVSTEQVMHPEKSWEWRDFPVRINVPETLPGAWRELSGDSLGEAGMAVFFGCQFKNLDRGLRVAGGWDGDRAVLYQDANGRRLLCWASAWDSNWAARRYAEACVKERQRTHRSVVTKESAERTKWKRSDGRVGIVQRDGKHVILLETDQPEALRDAETWLGGITFTEPPEDAARAAANPALLRFNPLFSRQQDGNYIVTRSLAGLLSRHDRNSVGSADRVLLGAVGELRRTASFDAWELGWGLLARHQSEARRGMTKTTLLPWGILASHFSTRAPHAPSQKLERTSVVWGLAGSRTRDEEDRRTWRILPWGLLFRSTSSPAGASVHVLGTGASHKKATPYSGSTTRFRLLGIPVGKTRAAKASATP